MELFDDARRVATATRNAVRRRVTIDTRTLAVFRIIAGLLILADAVLRLRNFHFFYTDFGVVTPAVRAAVIDGSLLAEYSVFSLAPDHRVVAFLFGLYIVIGFLLVLGYRTRTATVLAFVLAAGLDYHNPIVLSYADILFQLLLFWAIFLPLGERWSVDAANRDREPRESITSIASAIILLQMVTMYLINWIHKAESELWWSGDAAAKTLAMDHFTFLLGDFVSQFTTLLQLGGATWFALLFLSPALFALRGRPRYIFAACFVVAHLAFAVTVRIGAFAYVAIAGVILFVQRDFWRDAVAVLNATVNVESIYDRLSEAGERVARPFPYCVIISDRVDTSDIPLDRIPMWFVLFVVLSGFIAVQPPWGIFAPEPPGEDRYYVFTGETADGEYVDVYNERELTYDRPHDGELQKQFGTYRERFYTTALHRAVGDGAVAAAYGEHLCQKYEREHDVELVRINMWLIAEDITMDSLHDPEERDREATLVYQHGCGDHEPDEINPPEFDD